MARPSRRGRELDGVILVDKPLGMSSNDLLQKVKRLFDAKRAGHTGALDPLASGMLPVCLGEATKFSQYLLDADKRYLVTAKLGVRTDTSDVEGEVISVKPLAHTYDELVKAIHAFLGETEQIPSMYSALKYQGRPLYEYARQGIDVPRVSRPIYVHSIELIKLEDDLITLDIHCSKGTYIRTIIDDLGENLGCGAHVTKLHRIAVGSYPADKMINWFELLELAQPGFVSAKPELITDEHDHAFEAGTNIKFKLTYELHPKEKQARFDRIDNLLLPLDTPAAAFEALYLTSQASEAFSRGVFVQFFAKDSEALSTAKNHRSNMVVECLPEAGFKRVFNDVSKQFLGVGQLNDSAQLCPKRVVVLQSDLLDE
ncbi:tRNA pseudouridine(55) synthase TruB [Thorsellia anophelis]|uniref:tRNA pseudouridine synthase B n=1 Tax=Thorsellia anophelis DSM 18579 TaxID=1123402 RepID=A0A1H9Y921_9GAMM|nr:tRNA pseudouridine(55) synthase TruB [Thorsellia anophelis]SES65320.1 tRNA pseudouridine55 synthase [Thorsellia anophelis DSM 18579]